MPSHVENAHAPSTMRTLSNVGHVVEGAILSGAAVAMAADAMSDGAAGRDRAGLLLAGAGSLLGLSLVGGSFEHGGPVDFFRSDMQQRQHLQMAGLITAGGVARRYGRPGAVVSAGAIGTIGRMFVGHEQHGTSASAAEAQRKHARLGRTTMAAAAALAAGDVFGLRPLKLAGAALALASGVMLATYREPEEAYEEG